MNEKREFPPALVEQRAQELRDEYFGNVTPHLAWAALDNGDKNMWRNAARLSLRREVEACERVGLKIAREAGSRGFQEGRAFSGKPLDFASIVRDEISREYTPPTSPAPETLADVAREAAEALRGNAALSARLLAAVEREKVQP